MDDGGWGGGGSYDNLNFQAFPLHFYILQAISTTGGGNGNETRLICSLSPPPWAFLFCRPSPSPTYSFSPFSLSLSSFFSLLSLLFPRPFLSPPSSFSPSPLPLPPSSSLSLSLSLPLSFPFLSPLSLSQVYQSPEYEELAFQMTVDRLISIGYPKVCSGYTTRLSVCSNTPM